MLLLEFTQKLEAMEKGGTNWLKQQSTDVEGFSWKNGIQADTKVIWIWSRAFHVDGAGGEVAVILLDTQGIVDDTTSLDELTAIIGLSTTISSVMVLNLNGNIPAEVLSERLLPFLRYGDAAFKKAVDDPPRFQELSFLVRYQMSLPNTCLVQEEEEIYSQGGLPSNTGRLGTP